MHSPRAAGWLAYDKVKHLVHVALHAAAGTGEFAARLYKRLIAKIELSDVTSIFAMEQIKSTTELPLSFVRVSA